MTDELLPVEGISRRDLLKRSAIVGGASAMVWVTPSISSLGARAFGSEGSPQSDFSNFRVLIKCTKDNVDTIYRLQYEVDKGGWVEPGTTAAGEGGACLVEFGLDDDWTAAGVQNPAFPYDLSTEAENGSPLTLSWGVNVTLCVADGSGCTFNVNGGVAALKQATRCAEGTVISDGKCVQFSGPF